MGEERKYTGCLFFLGDDGTPEKLGDVETFEEPQEVSETVATFMDDTEVSMTFRLSQRQRRDFRRWLFGWRAKGPVRERMIRKARTQMFRVMMRMWAQIPLPFAGEDV